MKVGDRFGDKSGLLAIDVLVEEDYELLFCMDSKQIRYLCGTSIVQLSKIFFLS